MTVTALAAHAGWSEAYFRRAFRDSGFRTEQVKPFLMACHPGGKLLAQFDARYTFRKRRPQDPGSMNHADSVRHDERGTV